MPVAAEIALVGGEAITKLRAVSGGMGSRLSFARESALVLALIEPVLLRRLLALKPVFDPVTHSLIVTSRQPQ